MRISRRTVFFLNHRLMLGEGRFTKPPSYKRMLGLVCIFLSHVYRFAIDVTTLPVVAPPWFTQAIAPMSRITQKVSLLEFTL